MFVAAMISLLGAVAALLLTVYAGFYYYYEYAFGYWKRKNVPTPDGSETFWGHIKYLLRDDYLNVQQIRDWSKIYPKFYGIQKGFKKVLVVNDPDMAHEVLVKQFENFHGRELNAMQETPEENPGRANIISARGIHWKRLRVLSNPIFSVGNLKKVMPIMMDTMDKLLDHLDKIQDKPVNVHSMFQEMTMDVICRVAFGFKESQLFNNPYIDAARTIFTIPAQKSTNTWVTRFPFLKKLALKKDQLFSNPRREVVEKMHIDLYKEVMSRKSDRANGRSQTSDIDFIDLFLDAEGGSGQWEDDSKVDRMNMKVVKEMSISEMASTLFIFLLAGYDTTANSLSFLLFELVQHPEAMERLVDEIDCYTASENMTYEGVFKLSYLDACIKESLRLHPVAASIVNRRCMQATRLGDIVIDKEVDVEIDVLSINLSEQLWGAEPEKFRPERWIEETRSHPMAFMTFGGGPRICLGMRLALLEEKVMAIKLLERFTVSKCGQTEEQLKIRGVFVFYPDTVTVKLDSRKKAA